MQKTNVLKIGFWKYIKQVFVEGKMLFIKYVCLAVLSTIISVIANRLDIPSLTYFNAVLSVSYFATIIAYGISNGVGVYINQNFKNEKKVNKYAQIGFVLCLFAGLLSVAVLLLFPQFILEKIMSFKPDSYTFYYLMCIYFYLQCVANYISGLLKMLGNFKFTFLCETMPAGLIILGFMFLIATNSLILNIISVVYIVSTLIVIILGLLLCAKNKQVKICLLKFPKHKISLKEGFTIFNRFLMEFIWQIGYYATSVFLLRMGDLAFNTYSYLEYVLDIFNGLLFTFINVISLKICRAMGENKFEEAYQHGKYSILVSIFSWCVYALLGMLLIYVFALGVNEAYFKNMFTIIPLYIFMHSFRFLSWDLASYVLTWGGKTKFVLGCNIVYCVLCVANCFVAQILPNNIYLIYLMLTLPDLVIFPPLLIMFLRKTWLSNVNRSLNINPKKIKVFIFDFDDTLYWDMNDKFLNNIKWSFFDEHYKNLSKIQKKKLLNKFNVVDGGKFKTSDLCSILVSTDGNYKAWVDYMEDINLHEEMLKTKVISNEELKKFKRYKAKLFIVSDSRYERIKQFCRAKKIDFDIFDNIFTNDYKHDKYWWYKRILRQEKIKPKNVVVIGNDYTKDIKPARELDMYYYKCKDGFTFEEVIG